MAIITSKKAFRGFRWNWLYGLIEEPEKIRSWHVFLCVIFLYIIACKIAGFIPVNGGAGFDGSVYIDYVEKLAQGVKVENDPYRLIRVSGFLPTVLMAYVGLERDALIVFQASLNIILLSVAAALFFNALVFVTGKLWESLLATAAMVFSWPFLVMPVYYPILSDHVALLVAIISVWAWAHSRKIILYALVFLSTWIMPGLFTVPLILAVIPLNKVVTFTRYPTLRYFLFIYILLIGVFGYIIYLMLSLTDGEILNHPPGDSAGNPDLKNWSIGFVALCFIAIAKVWAQIFSSVSFYKSIEISSFIPAFIALVIGFLSIAIFVDWSAGSRGPPLLYFMLLQASAAPAKPLIAHFIHFGPIFIVAFLICINSPVVLNKASIPLFVLFSAYLPVFVLGSESRQWIAAFPISVALVAVSGVPLRSLLFLLFFAILFCFPIFMLHDANLTAIETRSSYMDMNWQLYFGRQGPWMSQRSYIIALVFMLLFFMCDSFIKKRQALM